MRALVLAVVPLLAACSLGSIPSAGDPDGNPSGDAAGSCGVFITFEPGAVIAAPDTTVRAVANGVPDSGVPTYAWQVLDHNSQPIAFTYAQTDHSQIEFPATTPGLIHATLGVSLSSGAFCNEADNEINVGTGSTTASYRLRVAAPPAPPQERTLVFDGGVSSFGFGTFALDPGVAVAGEVHGAGNVKVPAYLRFIPHGRPDQIVEAFTDQQGAFTGVQLVGETHDVLVFPTIAGYAPWLSTNFDPTSTVIPIGSPSTATGTVKAPNGSGLAGARVQLVVDGVPSTIATTAGATGAFSLLYEPALAVGAIVSIEVTPPDGLGLPRLTVASTALSASAPIAVAYAAALAPRDLAGAVIRRGGVPLASATITIAGTIAAAGTVNGIALAGDIHASAVASAAGVVPSLKAPNANLAAVVALSATDVALAAIDLTGTPPATIDAPAPIAVATTIHGAAGNLAGATLVAEPLLELAQAGIQPIAVTADAAGAVSLVLATGGHYDLRLADPSGFNAQTTVPNITAATFPLIASLPAAVQVTGKVTQAGGANPVAGAAIQVLCKACDGIDRTRPLAEAASAASGAFVLGVPDLP